MKKKTTNTFNAVFWEGDEKFSAWQSGCWKIQYSYYTVIFKWKDQMLLTQSYKGVLKTQHFYWYIFRPSSAKLSLRKKKISFFSNVKPDLKNSYKENFKKNYLNSNTNNISCSVFHFFVQYMTWKYSQIFSL